MAKDDSGERKGIEAGCRSAYRAWMTYVYGGSWALLSTLSPLPQEQEAVWFIELSLRSAAKAGWRCKPVRAAPGPGLDRSSALTRERVTKNEPHVSTWFGILEMRRSSGANASPACLSPPKDEKNLVFISAGVLI